MLDVSSLWDFSKPDLSEQRFRDAQTTASENDSLILETQIARTYGLRNNFARARELLAGIEDRVANASAEAQTRYALELGRTYASAAHTETELTPESIETARTLYMQAFEIAEKAKLDYLAVDALHMMSFVDTEPQAQLDWDLKAIEYMEASSQPEAKKWEASLRNNVGYAKQLLGDYDGALEQFKLSLAAHERAANARGARVANWMIAKTLRQKGLYHEAIAIQLRLEQEWELAGQPSQYVFEELELLYSATGDDSKADTYAEKLRTIRQ